LISKKYYKYRHGNVKQEFIEKVVGKGMVKLLAVRVEKPEEKRQ